MSGKEDKGPFFIVGNSRSGTTMLGRVFGNHSQINTFNELHFIEHQVDAETFCRRPHWPNERLAALSERLMTTAREGFFRTVVPGQYRVEAERILATAEGDDPVSVYEAFLRAETLRNGKTIACEQTPDISFLSEKCLMYFRRRES